MQRLTKGINWLAAGLLCWAALLAAFNPIHFFADQDWVQPAVMVILVAGLLVVINGLRQWSAQWSAKTYQRVLIGLALLIVGTQLTVAWQFVDAGRADAYFVRNQALALAQGQQRWNQYFLVYPNNVNFTLLEAALIKFSHFLGLATPWVALNILRMLWLDTGLIAGLSIIRHWQRWRPGALGLLLVWLLSVPIYAFGLFAYTDALVMPLTVDVLALAYLAHGHTGWRRQLFGWSGLLLIGLGVAMKSNMIVLWLALMLSFGVLIWQHKLAWTWLLKAAVALGVVLVGMQLWSQQSGYQKSRNVALPPTSWMAMSLNPTLSGQYNSADMQAVRDQPTAKRKQQQTKTMLKQRVQKLGAGGLLTHLFAKFRVFWATGDFDSFKLTSQWVRAPAWYLLAQRTWQFWLVALTQMGFIALLLGSIKTLVAQPHDQFGIGLIALMLIGLTLFHVGLWEVEARYALPFLPILMVLGVVGWTMVPVYHVQYRWLATALATWLAAFSALSILQTSQQVHQTNQLVASQGNGAYFTMTTAQLRPGQTKTLTVAPIGPSNLLELQPITTATGSRVQVTVSTGQRQLRQKTGTPRQLTTLQYPRTTASSLTIQLQNVGTQPLKYVAAQAYYNPATGAITRQSQARWRYYVIDRHPATQLTHAVTIGLVVSGCLGLTLMSLWYRPREH